MDFPVFDSVFIYLRRKNVLSEIFKKVFSCFLKFFKKSVDKCYENEYNNFCSREMWLINKEIEAWLSLVERCVRDAEVACSNHVASILACWSSGQDDALSRRKPGFDSRTGHWLLQICRSLFSFHSRFILFVPHFQIEWQLYSRRFSPLASPTT